MSSSKSFNPVTLSGWLAGILWVLTFAVRFCFSDWAFLPIFGLAVASLFNLHYQQTRAIRVREVKNRVSLLAQLPQEIRALRDWEYTLESKDRAAIERLARIRTNLDVAYLAELDRAYADKEIIWYPAEPTSLAQPSYSLAEAMPITPSATRFGRHRLHQMSIESDRHAKAIAAGDEDAIALELSSLRAHIQSLLRQYLSERRALFGKEYRPDGDSLVLELINYDPANRRTTLV